ncbi:hypothetical protein [Kolteria novifilia]
MSPVLVLLFLFGNLALACLAGLAGRTKNRPPAWRRRPPLP